MNDPVALHNASALQVETHVISSIVHVGHEYDDDNEPWPIEIEDHDGNLHAYNLEPGQVSSWNIITVGVYG
jgi:hypothetical protein